MSKANILLVDDDVVTLGALVEVLRSDDLHFVTATSGAEALKLLKTRGPFAVIVCDLRMPGTDGIEALSRARDISPDTVRILFTGQPDIEAAVAAVNKGSVFRFIPKPSSRVVLSLVLKSAVEQHNLITAQRVLLEQTLQGSIKALTETLAAVNPLAFGRAVRLRQRVQELACALHITGGWEVEVAAMVSGIGDATLPATLLEKLEAGQELTGDEEAVSERATEVVNASFAGVPRLEGVRAILHYHGKHFDGRGKPSDSVHGEAIPWGARALKLVSDSDRLERANIPLTFLFDTLRKREGWYDPRMLEELAVLRNSIGRPDATEVAHGVACEKAH